MGLLVRELVSSMEELFFGDYDLNFRSLLWSFYDIYSMVKIMISFLFALLLVKNDNGKIVFHSNKIVGSTMDNNNQGLKPDWTSSACILAACLLA